MQHILFTYLLVLTQNIEKVHCQYYFDIIYQLSLEDNNKTLFIRFAHLFIAQVAKRMQDIIDRKQT
jgi:hypothetical protein